MSLGNRRRAGRALELLALFAIYAATAELGLSFDALGGIATTVWPPTGIALAALFLRGVGLWPAVAAAAFAVNVRAGIPLWGAAIIAAGNTLEAVVGATLLRRSGFDSRLERLGDVFRLVGWAAFVSPMVSATLGLVTAELGHRTAGGAPSFWAVWWVGDALGDLLVAAFLFVWASFPRLWRSPLRWIEAALLALLLGFVSATLFRHTFAWRAIHGIVRGTYPTVPLLIWAALRFEQRGVTAAMLLVSGIAVSGAAAGNGIFGAESPHERLLLVQSYMAVTAVSMLTLAAALAERRAAIRARDEFISIASHELKTPLTALKLRLGSALRLGERLMAASDPEAGKMARALATSGATADRLGALVDDLLDVSRLTAGRLALRIERVELGELLREVVARLHDQAEEVGSAIELTIAAPIVGAWDRGRLEQLVTNLLSNAIKYGLGKPIAVSADVVAPHVRVRVHDAGIGIPRADQSRIFQAFERLPTAERVGGLGLGLYIGRQIAMAHGGTLTVESADGAGATFTLELPLEARPAAAGR
ncbi:MAG TPA: MASE1 domain-containing protein [Polyangia bacterium]|jgi:signal transduction histidine kinase